MIKFAAACGSGLGSSFMVEMNIQAVLKELGIFDKVEVSHYDLGSTSPDLADVWFVAADLAEAAAHLGDVRVLKSIIDKEELKATVTKAAQDKGLL